MKRIEDRLPWVQRRRHREYHALLKDRAAIMFWEFEHLPDEVQASVGTSLRVVAGGGIGSDAWDIESAADSICNAIRGYGSAEQAFRMWFETRYPFYAE
jgi:lactate dehydrogenase-like 2-hydroxyacid dehydrogenase